MPSVPAAPAARATRGLVASAHSPPPARPLPASSLLLHPLRPHRAPRTAPLAPRRPLDNVTKALFRASPPSDPADKASLLPSARHWAAGISRGKSRAQSPCARPEGQTAGARRAPPTSHDFALCPLLKALATVPTLGPQRGEPLAPSTHVTTARRQPRLLGSLLPIPGPPTAATWTWPWSLSYSASQQLGVPPSRPPVLTGFGHSTRWCLPRHRLLLTGSFPGAPSYMGTLPAAGPRPGSPHMPGNVSQAYAHLTRHAHINTVMFTP